MRPVTKSSLLALGVLFGGMVLWVAWLFIGIAYAGNGIHRAEQAVFGVTGTTGLAFLFGGVVVYRSARFFGASVPARWIVTLLYLSASVVALGASFFFTALAFNR
jgi:hypothetical protein